MSTIRTIDDHTSADRSADSRFWAKVRQGPDCWEWQGYRDRQGYGRVGRKAIGPVLAHRYAYTLIHGEIPAGGVIRHTCDNPPCVRPDHLLLGTQADNIRDRQERGRHRPGRLFGEDHPQAKLTNAQVAEIGRLRAAGLTAAILAVRFDVCLDTIYRVTRKRKDEAA